MARQNRIKTPTSKTIRSKVDIYLRERRQAGFRLKTNGLYLQSFSRFAENRRHRGPIAVQLAVAWPQASHRSHIRTAAHRLKELQPFLKYWSTRDPANQLVPAGLLGKVYPRVRPHVFTPKEIRDLLDAAACWSSGGLRAATYTTVFGLLATTGMRVSEALKLQREDTDLEHGVLTIRKTKFNKSRHVLLHPSARRALKHYAERRSGDPANSHAKNFFAVDGRPITHDALGNAFEAIRERLGWRCRGDRRWPRLHDLRFTFICRRIERWYADDLDVNNLMVSLSTYVGHGLPSATYWYLTATPKLMLLAARRSEGRA